MEVLDATVTKDDLPLCKNDGLRRVSTISTISKDPNDTNSCIKARYIFGLYGLFGFALVYAMRVNLSVAIVSMVKNSSTNFTQSIDDDNKFDWDEETQGFILGAFFLGYVLTNIPGGQMAEKYGGKLIYGNGILWTSVLTLVSPFAARWGSVPFIVIRVLEGMTEGVTYPAMHSMLTHWVPSLERNKFAAIVYAGGNLGTIISWPVSSWLCSLNFWGGWPLAFYLSGILGIFWSVLWFFFIYDTPALHPRIDALERAYIESKVAKTHVENSGVPWVSIFTSLPIWAIIITQCGQSWTFYVLLTELPTYMNKILHFDMQKDIFLCTLPYLTTWLVGLAISSFADALLARNYLKQLTSFKLWNTVATVGPSISFIGVIWAGSERMTVIMMLAGFGSLYGAVYAGNQMNHIALAPKYAGTLYGITNAASNICGFCAPYVTGIMINHQQNLERWHSVFWLAIGINIITNIFYLLFASATEQSWSQGNIRNS